MSGHSKWATIRRHKDAIDSKRGKIFTKLVREITTAARIGGGLVDGNPRLRVAVASAKAARMPVDNIERAIKRGTGDWDGPPVEDVVYEGYGPGGVALFIETQTDNKNRTTGEIRNTLSKAGGNLGTDGSVAWMFTKRGQFAFQGGVTEDQLMEIALEVGAQDVVAEGDTLVLTCEARAFAEVLDELEKRELKFESAELTMVPENTIKVTGEDAEKLLRLVEKLEDLDDVHKIYANFDIDDADLERAAAH